MDAAVVDPCSRTDCSLARKRCHCSLHGRSIQFTSRTRLVLAAINANVAATGGESNASPLLAHRRFDRAFLFGDGDCEIARRCATAAMVRSAECGRMETYIQELECIIAARLMIEGREEATRWSRSKGGLLA